MHTNQDKFLTELEKMFRRSKSESEKSRTTGSVLVSMKRGAGFSPVSFDHGMAGTSTTRRRRVRTEPLVSRFRLEMRHDRLFGLRALCTAGAWNPSVWGPRLHTRMHLRLLVRRASRASRFPHSRALCEERKLACGVRTCHAVPPPMCWQRLSAPHWARAHAPVFLVSSPVGTKSDRQYVALALSLVARSLHTRRRDQVAAQAQGEEAQQARRARRV